MKNIIIANWKCNPISQKEAKEIFDEIKAGIKDATAEIVVCPPFVYLALRSFSEGGFALGAQNLFWEEKEAGKREEVLQRQIQEGLKDVLDIDNINVAYEPVWAIGTGNNCSVEETKESIDFIRKLVPENVRILYGGSVKSQNSGDYIKKAGANGLLVGGASLNAEEFVKIVKSAE